MLKWLKKKSKKVKSSNHGHRLYGDFVEPENSFKSLRAGIPQQGNVKFKYWETDICESADGELYCFHDATKKKTVARLCNVQPMHDRLLDFSLYKLNAQVIDAYLTLKNGEDVPKLSSILKELVPVATKPIKLEIKKLNTDNAKLKLISLINRYQKESKVEISIMMKRKKFNKMKRKHDLVAICNKYNIKIELFGSRIF